jgi:glycerol-3-phosphate acyltransferase PlsX
MKIGLDVMGGDFAPEATLKGAFLARQELPAEDTLVLIGDQTIIEEFFSNNHYDKQGFEIIHSSEVIEMGDSPIKAFTKKTDSSIAVGFSLLTKGEIDTFSSAGNSGAMLVGSMYTVKTIPGVIRPTTTTLVPQEIGDISILLDIGTNPDVRPDVMVQFALIGSIYANQVHKIENPRVGLLNIGEEEEKGNLLSQNTFNLLKESEDINFIGNVESRDLFKSKADVIVCDGFTGNIVLKLVEAMYRMMAKRGFMDDYFKRFNYENYGGTPILGINSTVIIGHGISNDIAIKNMLLLSKEVQQAKLSARIKESFLKYASGQPDKAQ